MPLTTVGRWAAPKPSRESSERLSQHLERTARRLIVRMAIFITSVIALTAALYALR